MTRKPTEAERADLHRYLRVLAGEHPAGRWLEVRYAVGQGAMRQQFIGALRLAEAARLIASRAQRSDVYCGVVLRERRAGGRDAVSDSHLAFIEIDSRDACERLRRFASPPTMLVASGTSGHLHAYWQLSAPVSALELEHANRRLAHTLGGDLASVDAARILRPPASRNHKHSPAAAVRLLELQSARRYHPDELIGRLEDPPAAPRHGPARPRRATTHPVDRILLALPARDYIRILTGLEANRAGKLSCPFHPDETPSMQLYADNSFYCFGCHAGGSIYDFASRLWGQPTRGSAFLELRARLLSELGLQPASQLHASRRI